VTKVVAALAVAALAAGCGTGGPAPRGLETIVAARLADGLALYRMNPDGSGVKRLSPPDARDSQPAFSPDGRTIAFVRETIHGAELCAMDAQTSRIRVLHSLDDAVVSGPSWAPSGDKIAYAEIDAIAILDVRSRTLTRVFRSYVSHPTWSPDGREIAFERDVTDDDRAIWVMAADGTRARRLTHPHGGAIDHEPAWSPDGKQVAFQRNYDLWVVDVETGSERRLARFADYPSWSPDGRRLLVMEVRRPLLKSGLYVVDERTRRSKLVVRGFWTESTWQRSTAGTRNSESMRLGAASP
jgi:Tol biopolymer transport system component